MKHAFNGVLLFLTLWALGPVAIALAVKTPEGMVVVPEGAFVMGSSQKDIEWAAQTFYSESLDYYQDELPSHQVTLPEFFIDRTETTVEDYGKYLEATGKAAPKFFDDTRFNEPDQPVVGVTWQDASDYCTWAGKRLPTEAEWEKAARGEQGNFYPWGNEPTKILANVRGRKDGYRYSAPVGTFSKGQSAYGAMDMAGNVWEWTADWYGPHPGNDIKNDLFGKTLRVIKGGSWFSNLDLARASVRGKALPDQKQNYIGFRCVRPAA